MDKHELQIKTEQLEKLWNRQDYQTAAKIADTIDWRKCRNLELLMKVSEIYENLERYEDCYEILNMAYDCAPIGRMIVYRMTEVAVKMGNFDEAIELYKEFIKIAPHDLGRYVLKYKIYQGRGSSIEDQIAILEEYKSREYQEQWAYELATLYYKEGMLSKCVEECDDLILWFSEGEYVVKAMELKMRIQPLTASQEEKYRQLVAGEQAEKIEVKPVNMDKYSTTNLQEALAESLQSLIEEEPAQEESPEPVPPSPIQEPIMEEADEAVRKPEEETDGFVQEAAKAEADEASGEPEKVVIPRDTFPMPKFLGQDESGQLTFDMQENVLERQITGQMTIEDILNGWEEKKKETEAAIAEAAKRDEERRKEREHLRATGQLPKLPDEIEPTLPVEIQHLIDEIEGKIPVRVHVEPILRGESGKRAEVSVEEEPPVIGNRRLEETQDISTILELAEEKKPRSEEEELKELEWPEGVDDLLTILEAESLEELVKTEPEAWSAAADTPEESAPEVAEPEAAASEETTEEVSPMMKDLEETLEEELANIPPGQLSEEQKKLFAYFTSVRGMNKQLADLLEEDRMRKERREDSLTGNIVITGEGGTGKTTLAADIVKAIQKQRRIKGAKMAKISAGSLNGKNVSEIIGKLGGGALLIEKAGNMKTETAVQLSHAMTRKTGSLLVLLEDEKEEIRKLFIRCESLGAKFTKTIEIPTFTNKELVAFGESYAQERECVLDEMAVLALYNRIGNNQTSDHLVNVAEVKEMVDEAIERGGKKGLFGKIKKSRLDEFGNLILLEKDFEV